MLIDIIAGILISLGVAHFFEVPISPGWLFLGALFALLPDFDFFLEYLKRGTVGGKKLDAHRVVTHVPLLFLIPAVLFLVFVSTPVALLFVLCIIWHFLHDSHAMGYGYRLFYPFSTKFYKFFSDKEGNYRYDFNHLVTSWTREEVDTLHEKYGNENWIKDHVQYHSKRWYMFLLTCLRYGIIIFLLLLLFKILTTT